MQVSLPGPNNDKLELLDLFKAAGTIQSFEAGSLVSRFDDEESRILLILTGTLTVHVVDQVDDCELTISHLVPMDLFGLFEQPVEAGLNAIDLFAQAKTNCTVIEIMKSDLLAIGASSPGVLMTVCSELSRLLLDIIKKVGQFAFYGVRGRVSSALMDLCALPEASTHSQGVVLINTRTEIASMAGCTREMVGRILKELSAEGVITTRGRQIIVHTS